MSGAVNTLIYLRRAMKCHRGYFTASTIVHPGAFVVGASYCWCADEGDECGQELPVAMSSAPQECSRRQLAIVSILEEGEDDNMTHIQLE